MSSKHMEDVCQTIPCIGCLHQFKRTLMVSWENQLPPNYILRRQSFKAFGFGSETQQIFVMLHKTKSNLRLQNCNTCRKSIYKYGLPDYPSGRQWSQQQASLCRATHSSKWAWPASYSDCQSTPSWEQYCKFATKPNSAKTIKIMGQQCNVQIS